MFTTEIAAKPVRVVVVEGQALFGKALCAVLGDDVEIDVVGDAESVIAAPLRTSRADVIVVDVDGHAVDVVETMRHCREQAPRAKVCVLSTHLAPEVMQRCLSAGADGYVVKDIAPAELIRAVKTVAGGHTYVDPRIAGGVLKRRPHGSASTALSGRESEIVGLIARGLSNKEISARLGLSEKTVKNHISRIFAKLGINARTQAAVHAIRIGLV